MSYANYGPTYPVRSVSNFADIVVGGSLPGSAFVRTNLIRDDTGAVSPLVLPAGTWVVNANTAFNPVDDDRAYSYCQPVIVVGGIDVAYGAGIFGGTLINPGGGVVLNLPMSYIVVVPAGETRSLTYQVLTSGCNVDITFIADSTNMVATKISN